MPNIGSILREEISRLCRREIRRQIGPMRKASAGYRREIAALKRKLVALDRRANALAKSAGRSSDEPIEQTGPPVRFVAKGLRSLRKRLGLSAPNLGKLLGVSTQSVYNWETKKASPRKEQLAKLVELRAQGKKAVAERLATVSKANRKRSTRRARR